MSRYTCEEMGVCKDTGCDTCPHTAGLPAGPCNQSAPVRRETDSDNLLEWQNTLLAQALAEQQDAEDRERMLKVLAPPKPRPFPPPWKTKEAVELEERGSDYADFVRELVIYTVYLFGAMGIAMLIFLASEALFGLPVDLI